MAQHVFRQRLAAMAAASAPSMVPTLREDIAPPPGKVKEIVPSLAEVVHDARVRIAMARMIDKHGELGEAMSGIKSERDALGEQIKALAGTHKVGKALAGEWRMNYYLSKGRATISDKLLLAQGVTPAQIAASTKTGVGSYNLKIVRVGSAEDEE